MGAIGKFGSWRFGRRNLTRDTSLAAIAANLIDAEDEFQALVSDIDAVLLDAPRSALPEGRQRRQR